uniref:ATP synthase subunit b n=1 Tax=Desulfobacca acetoxidans TaxID=60893 RepID=A0A7V4LC40_9BACT
MKAHVAAMRWWVGIFLGLAGGLLLAGAALAAAGGGEHGMSEAKIQDLIWRTVNFLVFAGILIKLVAKPAKQFFAQRAQDISATFDELAAKKAEAEEALKAAEARLAAVEAERQQIIQQFVAEGEAEKAKILEKAKMVADRIKEMAAFSISQATKQAAQELKQEVAQQAVQMAEELLKKEITFTDQQQLVEEFLQKVVEKH